MREKMWSLNYRVFAGRDLLLYFFTKRHFFCLNDTQEYKFINFVQIGWKTAEIFGRKKWQKANRQHKLPNLSKFHL